MCSCVFQCCRGNKKQTEICVTVSGVRMWFLYMQCFIPVNLAWLLRHRRECEKWRNPLAVRTRLIIVMFFLFICCCCSFIWKIQYLPMQFYHFYWLLLAVILHIPKWLENVLDEHQIVKLLLIFNVITS